MPHVFLAVLASLVVNVSAASAKPARDVECTADEYGYCTDKRLVVELRDDRREVHIPLNTALGDVLVIWLPRGAAIPKCRQAGNTGGQSQHCIDNGNPAAFAVDVQEIEGSKQFKVTVRPYINEAARKELNARLAEDPRLLPDDLMAGLLANLQLPIDDRWLINFDLTIGPAEKAVRQILLESKDLAVSQDAIARQCDVRNAELRAKLQEGWANINKRATEAAAEELTYAVLRRRRCRSGHWTTFRDQLWLQADSTCEIGDYRFLTFRLRNRAGGGDLFRIGEVAILVGNSKEPQHLDAVSVFARPAEQGEQRALGSEEVELSKDEEVVGAVRFAAQDVTGAVTLRILEAGGKGRELNLKGISF